MEAIIEINNVKKIYQTGAVSCEALKGISLTVRKGGFISLVGPSGSGKTTALNLMGCLDAPTEGRIFLEKVDITQLTASSLAKVRREKIGFIFQSFNLLQALTVYENIELPLLFDDVGVIERRNRALSLMEIVGIKAVANHRVTDISGGQQQRTAIARALVKKPLFVLADEPTGNLDSENGKAIMELMRGINVSQGVTFVIATHDPVVMAYTNEIIRFHDGKIAGASS